MVRSIKKQSFEGNIIMVGCGSIGQALLPLIHRHIENMHGCITVLSASESGRGIAERNGAQFIHSILTPGSYRNILNQYVRKGDFLLNMSVGVSSMDLIRFCYEKKMLYVDTSIEPWPGVFDNPMLELQDRTNYAIRNKLLKLATELGSDSPTAIVDHGANPGIVSHFVKQALISLNHQFGNPPVSPESREEWATLAKDLNISTIQISERDTQACQRPKRQGEFINTWSIEGFIDELMQPAECSFGTSEEILPKGAHEHQAGSGTIFLKRPGASTFARSWTPSTGGFQGMLISHDEVFSIADYLTIRTNNKITYRPTVMFVYHPCDDAMLSALELEGNGWVRQPKLRKLESDITEGRDELGVLLAGHQRNAFWFGSQLNIEKARQIVPYANATTMQVVAGAIAAIIWAIQNPTKGLVEPEALDYKQCLTIAKPYLGTLIEEYTDWTPLEGRGKYFAEKLDEQNPWRIQNIRSRQWFGD